MQNYNFAFDNETTIYTRRSLSKANLINYGELLMINDALVFSYPAYVVYSDDLDKGLLSVVLEELTSAVPSIKLVSNTKLIYAKSRYYPIKKFVFLISHILQAFASLILLLVR